MSYKDQKKKSYLYAATVMILPFILFASACNQPSAPAVSDEISSAEMLTFEGATDISSPLGAQLAEVRRATAKFQDFEKAETAGWFAQISPCVESPSGGMGYHYGNPLYLGDTELDPLTPEALLYEPQKNGRLRLVGVEYIVPYEDADQNPNPQPSLFGQDFDYTPPPVNAWTLHVWLWRNNPSGMFTAYNPKVNCDYAP